MLASSDSSLFVGSQVIVGVGKSTLISTVIDRYWIDNSYHSQPVDEGFAFFYYSKDDQKKDDKVVQLFRSFIRQLATVPRYPQGMLGDLRKRCDNMAKGQRAFNSKICQDILSSLFNILPRTILVIDGLDEFEEQDMKDVVRILLRLVKESERPVKIFISSRDRPDIRSEMSQAGETLSRVVMADENRSDIERFVRERSEEIGSQWGRAVREKVVKDLCNGASGMCGSLLIHHPLLPY